jgi:hypothetical protein
MRGGRYEFAGGGQPVRWPFAAHEMRVTPLIAPEFQVSFQRILTTSRSYFHLERELERGSRKRGLSHR